MNDRVIGLFRDHAITIAKRGCEVVLIADYPDDALAIYEWAEQLCNKPKEPDDAATDAE